MSRQGQLHRIDVEALAREEQAQASGASGVRTEEARTHGAELAAVGIVYNLDC